MIEKEFSFQNAGLNDKVIVFHSNIKRHLSNEFVNLSNTKDELKSELNQLKIEKSQRDKQLFQNIEKRDSRRFFTPLNVVNLAQEEKDEKKKQLNIDIENLEDQISHIESKLEEIKVLLNDIDGILNDVSSLQENSELPVVKPINVPTLSKENNVIDNQEIIYPQLIRNLYNLSDEFKSKYEDVDVLIEFNDNNIELDLSLNNFIYNQLYFQIEQAIDEFDANVVLIQGLVNNEKIEITLSYACENEMIDSLKLVYNIDR